MPKKLINIGGASGFWGDAGHATAQLLSVNEIDYIVYDYLAEVTMSLLARARAKDSSKGYAVSFVSEAMLPNLKAIQDRGIKVISNAGGVNPKACAEALSSAIEDQGLNLKVAWIEGDDLIDEKAAIAASGTKEMFSCEDFPPLESVQSMNAYLGGFPIARALDRGADIVITGRCVDSAVTLGACIHHFQWARDDLDCLAMASLAGHILECGVQATGGNFTDWEQVKGREYLGYPIVEIEADGRFVCTKPDNTGGLVSIGTVAEQLVYEIGDPGAYILPDVVCDFREVSLTQLGCDRVQVLGAKGLPAPDHYKVSTTFADQFRGGTYVSFYGDHADKRAEAYAEAVFKASRNIFQHLGLSDFSETSTEVIGSGSQFGHYRDREDCQEAVLKIAAKHPDKIGVGIMLKQLAELALATPPGLSGFAGNSPKIAPVVRLFSHLLAKPHIVPRVHIGDESFVCHEPDGQCFEVDEGDKKLETIDGCLTDSLVDVPLKCLAWARSGDKGNHANVGVIARQAEYLPYINAALSESVVADRFAHFSGDDRPPKIEKFPMPGIHAINFLLHNVLGGGGIASLRNDPQAKGYSQLLLACSVPVPHAIAEKVL